MKSAPITAVLVVLTWFGIGLFTFATHTTHYLGMLLFPLAIISAIAIWYQDKIIRLTPEKER